jgi:hypothetical protein
MLPVNLTSRDIGAYGTTVHGSDPSSLLRVQMTTGQLPDKPLELACHFDFEPLRKFNNISDADPASLHRILSVLTELSTPNRLRIRVGSEKQEIPCTDEPDRELRHARNLVGDIVDIREAFSIPLAVPAQRERELLAQIRFAAKLARYETGKLRKNSHPTAKIKCDRLDSLFENFGPHGTGMELHSDYLRFQIASHAINIAPVWIRYTRATVEITPGHVRRKTDSEVPVTFIPTSDSEVLVSRRPFPDSPRHTGLSKPA